MSAQLNEYGPTAAYEGYLTKSEIIFLWYTRYFPLLDCDLLYFEHSG